MAIFINIVGLILIILILLSVTEGFMVGNNPKGNANFFDHIKNL